MASVGDSTVTCPGVTLSSPLWSPLVTTHVSQIHVVMKYLKIDEHSAYIVALVTCSFRLLVSRLVDVTGGREDWVHGHLGES